MEHKDMSAYMVSNVGMCDPCQHRLNMYAYMFNYIGIGDLCQHRSSMSA